MKRCKKRRSSIKSVTTDHDAPTEVLILARVLGSDRGSLPATAARYYLTLEFNEEDKARMYELAIRNQDGVLSPAEQQELFAYAKAGSLLSLLKSRARRVLRVKPKKPATS